MGRITGEEEGGGKVAWVGFAVGLIVGFFLGVLAMGWMTLASQADRDAERILQRWKPRTGDAGRDAE